MSDTVDIYDDRGKLLESNVDIMSLAPTRNAAIQKIIMDTKLLKLEVDPGDTKCDLTIHPPEIHLVDVLQQLRSTPGVTIVSEHEIVLQSGRPGVRREVESLGRSLSLYTALQSATGNERAVVLTCFGELAPFDEIAVTLGPSR